MVSRGVCAQIVGLKLTVTREHLKFLKKTNIRALETVPLEILLPYAIDVH